MKGPWVLAQGWLHSKEHSTEMAESHFCIILGLLELEITSLLRALAFRCQGCAEEPIMKFMETFPTHYIVKNLFAKHVEEVGRALLILFSLIF